ncbi:MULTISPECIES: hypothetical protein [Pseudomonas]|uniref:Uncharacterized protein n=1 Tax=Pseudomonas asiatica TaxID=2219225 RepID=A0AAJ5HX45_9PSED|nr:MULTISPECIES: hypothetical protein [Pseudomonas]POF96573.1 hypothetical protein BGP81_07495 [Pseudomonas putida]UUC21436.1 hypothetical protein NOV18_13530 [Pseudomonas asiatica]
MTTSINLDFLSKRHTDFDLRRIARAMEQGFDEPVTAYLTDAFIMSRVGGGVVFGFEGDDPAGRYADGRVVQTAKVDRVEKEGRFWVLTTVEGSRYVMAAFRREGGRNSLRDFLQMAKA